MPKPTGKSAKRYLPGLDGLRGVAVLAVIAYHYGFDWSSGGLLGVGVFFTLSGYLITDILLERWAKHRLSMTGFWLARARRLLPALLLMLVVVAAWITIGDPTRLASLRGETLASTFFVANWWFIFHDVSYFEQFGPPSPLGHIWSLGVEEQFYILWPAVLLLGLALVNRGGRIINRSQVQPRLAIATLGLALASIALMAVLFVPGADSTRAYEGTDTRAFGVLIGAALAMVWPSRRLFEQGTSQRFRRLLDVGGMIGLAGIFALIATTSEFSPFIYRGGLVLLSLATAMVVAAVVHPATLTGRLLGVAPLRWIGVRSYGIYLWQAPIILLTTPALAPFSPLRMVLQVGATLAISALSWHYLEDPIRHGAIGRLWQRLRQGRPQLPRSRRRWAVGAGAVLATGLVAVAAVGLAGGGSSRPLLPIASIRDAMPETTGKDVKVKVANRSGRPGTIVDPSRTACRSVAYIGDSTSLGMVMPELVPNRRQRLNARLAGVGVERQQVDVAKSRSILAAESGTTSGREAVRQIRRDGFRGCWVIALTLNDIVFMAGDYRPGAADRVATLMKATGNRPVLWVAASMLKSGTPGYIYPFVAKWNRVLKRTCRRQPRMRLYDWGRDARPEWYGGDGIHYTTTGYSQRARMIAAALVSAFPSGQPLPGPGVDAGRNRRVAAGSACDVRPSPAVLRSPVENLKVALGGW